MVKIQSLPCVSVKPIGHHMTALAGHFTMATSNFRHLAIYYNKHKESEALGLFILAVLPEIIATVLLLEAFNCI